MSVEALVEVDAQAVRLAAFVMSQRVLTVRWNGVSIETERNAVLPTAIEGAHVLRDLQLAYWPASAIRAVLPVGWDLQDTVRDRTLSYRGEAVVTVRYSNDTRWIGHIELSNHAEAYQLTIDSVPVANESKND